jgi:MSHA biogenesis protein MshO
MRTAPKIPRRCRGFTVVELVISMVLATLVAGFVAMMIGTPVDAFLAQSRRAELSDSAETAMRLIGDDVRRALPDSVRSATVGGSAVLEMIDVVAVANYRPPPTTAEPLNINADDNLFDAVVAVNPTGPIRRLVVGHRKQDGSDAYAPTNASGVITPDTTTVNLNGTGTQVSLTSMFRFTTGSPTHRAYLTGDVTRYECNNATGELRRSRGSAIAAAPANVVAPYDVIARDVAGCSFQVLDGTADHGGIAIVEITISRTTNGNPETLRMFRQLRVENVT